jgi:hypothetical protein
MPAKSEKQQTAARIALAIKKGKVKPKAGTASAQMAKGMSKEKIKHFTKMENGAGTASESGIAEKEGQPKRDVTSDKQRAFLNARFGHAYVKRHFKGAGEGEKPTYAHGGKTTSPEVKAAFKKKKKTEETTTSVNIGSQGTSTVTPRPRFKLKSTPPPFKKKKTGIKTVRSYTGREMADARDRVMQMVTEYEMEQGMDPASTPKRPSHIGNLQNAKDQAWAQVGEADQCLTELMTYLNSPKFREDTTVQVRDIFARIEPLRSALTELKHILAPKKQFPRV